MKKITVIVLMLCATLVIISCSDSVSYTDRLNAERDAIESLMEEEGIVVLKNYPEDGVFAENEFVQLDNDVYLNVIDSGNGNHIADMTRQSVICRFEARFFMSDTTTINGFASKYLPVTMSCVPYYDYNTISASAVEDGSATSGLEMYVSEGLASGLLKVGDSAVVKLIVPFKVSSSVLLQMYEPVYFSRVRYIFEK